MNPLRSNTNVQNINHWAGYSPLISPAIIYLYAIYRSALCRSGENQLHISDNDIFTLDPISTVWPF